jgi:PBP1b-binding outer membrane lipoprotein LpoB
MKPSIRILFVLFVAVFLTGCGGSSNPSTDGDSEKLDKTKIKSQKLNPPR